jgi:hypothetical protein
MYFAPRMCELQTSACLDGYGDGLFQGEASTLGVLQNTLYITAAQEFDDHEGLAFVLSEVEYRNDVRMRAKTSHRLSLTGYAVSRHFVQAIGLDKCKSNIPVQQRILSKVDHLFATFTQESLHLIAAIGEGGRHRIIG